jgi:ATP-dependent Clp protease adaptor protein ClpS
MGSRFAYVHPMVEYLTSGVDAKPPPVMAMGAGGAASPAIEQDQQTDTRGDLAPGYLVICWNDPINLMDYVTHVFRKVFGWPKPKAEEHMLQVHHQGKSILTRESMERAEHYVHQLQGYGLQATMERD